MIKVGSDTVGSFRAVTAWDQEQWKWNSTRFPAGGWDVEITATSGGMSPSLKYEHFTFEKSPSTPYREWASSRIYKVTKNGSLIGWLEVEPSTTTPDLAWWSNGDSLVGSRFDVDVGDDLSFTSGASLPASAYQLKDVQQPL